MIIIHVINVQKGIFFYFCADAATKVFCDYNCSYYGVDDNIQFLYLPDNEISQYIGGEK